MTFENIMFGRTTCYGLKNLRNSQENKVPNIKELLEIQKERTRKRDRIDTCDNSMLPKENRLWCRKRNKTLVRAYCDICPKYDNEFLEIRGED